MPTNIATGFLPPSATPGRPVRIFAASVPGRLISVAIAGGETTHYLRFDVDNGLPTSRILPTSLPPMSIPAPSGGPLVVSSQGRLANASLETDLDFDNLEIFAWATGSKISQLAAYWVCWSM